jgi:hypothetical protein
MYVMLLRRSLDTWSGEPRDDELLDHVLARRHEILVGPARSRGRVDAALAVEVGYDRALFKLARTRGIETSIDDFAKPDDERRRLERALADLGVDLTNLARVRRN